MHDRPTALSLSLSDGHSEAVANLLKTALSSPTNMSQQWCAPPRHFRCMLLLLGSCVLLSIVALFSLWTKLPSHGSLRRASVAVAAPVSSQAEDLFSLVQKRQHKMDTLSRELLHLDDLASSDSYQQWAPLVVSKCMHGMDERTAPCIKEANRTNLVEAQELLYPSFRLKLPTFASAMMKADWLSKGLHVDRMRVSEDRVWANYPTFQGQNMVFSNAVFRGNPPPDVWSEQGCMGRAVSHASFAHGPKAREMKTTTSVDTLVVATSLDSWSFQHFIDRVAVVWSQAQLVIPTTKKSETAIVSGKEPRDSIVNQIYQVMVGRHLHKPGTVSKGGKASNGGRQILNEPKLFDTISFMLNTTGRPERLQYFRHDEFNGLQDVATFVRDRVKMMIGPHGAAFYNARFAQPRTALIEIIPDPGKFFVPCFWEQARLLGQDYSAHVGTTVRKNNMMVDDVQDVVGLVRDRLAYLDNRIGCRMHLNTRMRGR